MTTLFDLTPESPAAPASAGPRPLVIALDAATIVTGTAGVGWTDYVHSLAKNLHERFAQQLEGCASFDRNADYVVIEGAAFSKNTTGADALAAMRWMLRQDLWKRGIPYAVINPQSRNEYATGKKRPVPATVPKNKRYEVGKGMKLEVVVVPVNRCHSTHAPSSVPRPAFRSTAKAGLRRISSRHRCLVGPIDPTLICRSFATSR